MGWRGLALAGLLSLAGCSGSMNPKACVDTTALPALPGAQQATDGPTDRCGGFVLGISVGERSPAPAQK